MALLTRRLVVLGAAGGLALLTSCSSKPAATAAQPDIVVESPWVRTTDGSTDTTMSAAFLTLSNPGDANVSLVGASTSVANMCEIHEMVKDSSGKTVMQKAPNGVAIPAGSHLHLTPGGYHVMLMGLKQPLPVGSEVTVELAFSSGQKLTVTAPVKVFSEEEDHYHGTPTPSTK